MCQVLTLFRIAELMKNTTAPLLAIWLCISRLPSCLTFTYISLSASRHRVSQKPPTTSGAYATQKFAFSDKSNESEPYCPDGLTPQEYQEIKRKEAERLKKMNFGMFGPRFRQAKRPSDDWFLMPSLWTGNFGTRQLLSKKNSDDMVNGDSEGRDKAPRLRKIFDSLQTYAPAFMLAFTLVEVVMGMASSLHTIKQTRRQHLKAVLKVYFLVKRTNFAVSAFLRAEATKAVVAGILTYPCELYLEHANRKWLWSRRRSALISIFFLFALFMSWTMTLLVLKHKFGVLGG